MFWEFKSVFEGIFKSHNTFQNIEDGGGAKGNCLWKFLRFRLKKKSYVGMHAECVWVVVSRSVQSFGYKLR